MRNLFLAFVVSFVVLPAAAQKRVANLEGRVAADAVPSADSPIRNATLELMRSDEGRAAIAEYQRMKATGDLPLAPKSSAYELGETRTFQIRDLSVPNSQLKYDVVEYELMAIVPGVVNIWVEIAEMDNGHVLQQDVDVMRQFMGESTSGSSYDPGLGIVQINELIFGPPPDSDGDGVLDFLVGDIQDEYTVTGSGQIVLGFFDPANMSGRNLADIIYLDSYPGILNFQGVRNAYGPPSQTGAHEHQHLIFAAINGSSDLAFVNEGLSEWAEVATGFTARPITYLQNALQRRKRLLDFQTDGSDNHYQRAGLFTNYLADRIGVLEAGAIARSDRNGAKGYEDVLSGHGLTLPDVIREFHVANLLNDRSIDDAYGYSTPQRSNVRVIYDVPNIDGTSSKVTQPTSGTIGPGGAEYVSWTFVRDLQLDVRETNGNEALLAPVLVAAPEVGPVEVIPFEPGAEPFFLDGSYAFVILVLPHVYLWDPDNFVDDSPPSASYSYAASWKEFESVLLMTAYDTGTAASLTVQTQQGPATFNAISLEPTGQKANRFDVPQGNTLMGVLIDQPYEHNFQDSNVPVDAPRDFTLVIWDVILDEDGNELPGNELFTLDVADPSQTGFGEFIFHLVDLSAYRAQLRDLPPVVFIGSRNAGSDNNFLSMTISTFAGPAASPSFFYDTFFGDTPGESGWGAFSEVCIGSCDDVDLNHYVIPIRAIFGPSSGPTALEEDGVLPESIALDQNYPNPFNPATSIRFSLPQAERISLKVFDMLGREVRTLANGLHAAGDYELSFDASGLASGIYVYTLRTQTSVKTRTMTVLK